MEAAVKKRKDNGNVFKQYLKVTGLKNDIRGIYCTFLREEYKKIFKNFETNEKEIKLSLLELKNLILIEDLVICSCFLEPSSYKDDKKDWPFNYEKRINDRLRQKDLDKNSKKFNVLIDMIKFYVFDLEYKKTKEIICFISSLELMFYNEDLEKILITNEFVVDEDILRSMLRQNKETKNSVFKDKFYACLNSNSMDQEEVCDLLSYIFVSDDETVLEIVEKCHFSSKKIEKLRVKIFETINLKKELMSKKTYKIGKPYKGE
jgi:hypothetical protein